MLLRANRSRPFTWYANKYCARVGVQTLAWTFERRASCRNIVLASGVTWKSVLTLRLQNKSDEILNACSTVVINVHIYNLKAYDTVV